MQPRHIAEVDVGNTHRRDRVKEPDGFDLHFFNFEAGALEPPFERVFGWVTVELKLAMQDAVDAIPSGGRASAKADSVHCHFFKNIFFSRFELLAKLRNRVVYTQPPLK
jgi:hypothetical protein